LAEELKKALSGSKQGEGLTDLRKQISNSLNSEVLYLPTYRRIEKDLSDLGYMPVETGLDDLLLQSGMGDVEERINRITSGIKDGLLDWFNRLDKNVWEQLVGLAKIKETEFEETESLKIVMDQIHRYVSQTGTEDFLKLFDYNKIGEPAYNVLEGFLSEVIEVYDLEKERDEKINRFIAVCNGYFVDKQMVYNQAHGKVEIIQGKRNISLPFYRLSSGEKQIISLFSKLYLETERPCVLIIDEPELSVSIEWQRTLLPDILKSQKCRLLIAATHSPFIFDNDLNIYTVALNEYIKDR
jgi:hypothetical protein